ncbi:ribonuclease H protein, partial [Trifolium medium]|nr:ribonuclease H protein [Trifolium medium]
MAKKSKPYRYEQIWSRDVSHINIVKDSWNSRQGSTNQKLKTVLGDLHKWGNLRFGVIPKRIKTLQGELQNLNANNGSVAQIKEKELELDDILECEEMWWGQRSRALWLQHGDKNTKYFHMKANIRRTKNAIEEIKDSQGHVYHDESKIEQVVQGKISTVMHQMLSEDFTEIEVLQAIKDMKSLVAPGPDGLPALFYHNYWDIIGNGNDVTNMINHPTTPSDFRPISLCNVTLKIITKTLANRIKLILPEVISPNQSAFISGRLITDNTIIASDIFHYLSHTNRKSGYVGIKTDMAKAYDRVEWDFLEATLTVMGFPETMVQTIMKCVTTVTFSILINGHPSMEFQPQRGLRQGDPLSPYLFIICADVLSGLITRAQNNHSIHGVKIALGAPEISHLLFADDSLMFCRASTDEVSILSNIIHTYQGASGQPVNLNKSEMVFSKGTTEETKRDISRLLPMQILDHFSKYLGMPTFVGRSKARVFNYIQDKIWKKLKGWKERNLSFAGRGILIKVVAQAIPTYIMSSFLIPKGVCAQMEKAICNFWWGSTTDHRKIHWINWHKICKQKNHGGMGFRDMRAFNEGCYWTIGSGEGVDIWQDNWIHQKGNSSTWSRKPEEHTNYKTVHDVMDTNHNGRNEALIHQLFIPFEAQKILQIPITDKSQPDILTWDGTMDGNYYVKSGYQALMSWSNSSTNGPKNSSKSSDDIWKMLWQLSVPPKHSHFIWRALNNALSVKANLFKKGVRCDPMCPRCFNQVETTHHALFDCVWAKLVWFASPLTINLNNCQFTNLYDWVGKDLPPYDVCSTAIAQLQEFQSHCIEKQPMHRAPPSGLLRRSDGSTVGAATRMHQGSDDVVLGEAFGLNDAMDMVEKLGITSVIFETDSQIIVNAVNKHCMRKNWGLIVQRCIRFILSNPNSQISWVNRNKNRVAHTLALWAEMEPNMDWPNSYPPLVFPTISKKIW